MYTRLIYYAHESFVRTESTFNEKRSNWIAIRIKIKILKTNNSSNLKNQLHIFHF